MGDGHPQSHLDRDDLLVIEFEYVQHFALVMDALSPTPPAALGFTHIGGAGLTRARYVEATRPASPQIVLEPDEQLTEAVRRELPLPRGHRIRVRGLDGVLGIAVLRYASADVIVAEYHAAGALSTPAMRAANEASSPEFTEIFTKTTNDVDDLVTAHTHQTYAYDIPAASGTHPVIQSGSFGKSLAEIQLGIDPKTKKVVSTTCR